MLILLSICLLSDPSQCREDRIDLSFEARSPTVCLRNSQSALAKWQAEHPEWHVNRWRCAVRGNVPRDL
ncbi:hypothetical protein PMNALOAF_4337 [Methylobacterium adhaesivum]|jgi:hypothetical protein|uniref:Uncharacterized protein n=1 Tax=Methylobacterium adhaesivum TaxID=333297 RepID=A0ABT8BAV8_9HYPH|nr:hypothetical protein [Methylobacterium adhaesivum]MDN3589157.1 hypothetical protein [Methylobacterium adhaesivum]GJD33056.1 hypothetical protein PMNALOAF_4337 [Methylobacterium adhaesivum]